MLELANLQGNLLVIEDEPLLSRALVQTLTSLCNNAVIEPPLASVREMKTRAVQATPPSIIFSDIQLSDGLSLEALDLFPATTAVIFTTAFDQYALRVFRYNALDYLLKPIHRDDLIKALDKYRLLNPANTSPKTVEYAQLAPEMLPNSQPLLRRLMLKKGKSMVPLSISEAAIISLEESVVFVTDNQGVRYLSDFRSLDEVEIALNPEDWFRANRQTLVARNAINHFETDHTGKLQLRLNCATALFLTISKEKAASFKRWLV